MKDHTIRPAKQLFRHDPENGVWGDCYRTAVAIVLGVEPTTVPHFMDRGGSDDLSGNERCRVWLAERGLDFVEVAFSSLEKVVTTADVISIVTKFNGAAAILCGERENGVSHSVVIRSRGIVCDPLTGKPGDPKDIHPIWHESGDWFYFVRWIVNRPSDF